MNATAEQPTSRPRVLVADDSRVAVATTRASLSRAGYEVITATDGVSALNALTAPNAPRIAVIDWDMPGLTGPDVCKLVRQLAGARYPYLILLTALTDTADLVRGLESGADDFISKPCPPAELCARVKVGDRLASLQSELSGRVHLLEQEKKKLVGGDGFVPICMHCHHVRGVDDQWETIEEFFEQRSQMRFSHSICETCLAEHHPEDEDPN